jgi:hypothetical protein
LEAARAEFLCSVGERFGVSPMTVAGWPVATMRVLEADAVMRRAREARAKQTADS